MAPRKRKIVNETFTSEVGLLASNICEMSEENNSENIIENDTINCERRVENSDESVDWRAAFQAQNKSLIKIIKKLAEPNCNNKKNDQQVSLPKFNSESVGVSATAWCSTVDLIMSECSLEGSALIIALSRSLEGNASQWLSQICFPGIKWENFRELFLQRFGCVETAAATVLNVLNSCPSDGENLSAFASRLATTLVATWKGVNEEEIAVSVALAQAARHNNKFRRILFTTDIKSINDMQKELKAFEFEKSSGQSFTEHSELKRIRLSSGVKCHFCGKLGHKMAECRARKTVHLPAHQINKNTVSSRPNTLTCFKCGNMGHIASRCPQQKSDNPLNKKPSVEKRIDACTMVTPTGLLVESGESFQFCFDSGAECSLIKESVAVKFKGKIIKTLVALKGIGNVTVFSTYQILSNIVISNYSLEILFHVLSDEFINYDIMIGQDILSLDFGISITKNNLTVYKCKAFNLCSTQADITFDSVTTELQADDKKRLITLLKKYRNWFATEFPKTRISTGELHIRLIDPSRTVQRRPYRMSWEERQVVRDKISELLSAKIIQPSCSPFASPILLVKKKNGSERLCVDYRELNSNTVANKFPLPLIADHIARLRGARYFTSLDMVSGFHQVPVHPESIEKTAFVTPDGQYEFLTMPFGLKNAPSCFQRAIMKALEDLVYSFVVVYMDDVLIVASSQDEAFERLQVVLQKLTDAGFSLNLNKCAFLQTSIHYLGYHINSDEIRPNPNKIKALTELTPPSTVSQLRQFLGLASYFRKFVCDFSKIMKPLYSLINAKTFLWDSEHENIRQTIISILTKEPVLIIFDPELPIELHTDASSAGYGAILLHKTDNKLRVIEYYSKTTSNVESRYHSYELETLAVVNSIKHFRHYLVGQHFVVVTDCNSLKASRTKTELSPRVYRWWSYLQAFDFEVQYREGKRMAHVDFLSRNPLPKPKALIRKVEEKRINLAEISDNWLLAEQLKDEEIVDIVSKIQKNELAEGVSRTYEMRGGILHRKIQRNLKTLCLPVVPRSFRWAVINHVHEAIMHLEWEKTLEKVYQHYWFEHMSKYVRKFVENCITCKLSKPVSGKSAMELHPIPKIGIPWHTVHIDITGKLSGKNDLKEYVIVQIDAFTKFVFLHHAFNIDTENCIKALKSSCSVFGIPTRIIADQGRCFASRDFREFCSSQNLQLHLIATGASRANGQVERVMSTLKSLLTAVESSNRCWQDALGEVQLALNCTINSTTKASPLELMIGKEARPFGLLSTGNAETTVDRSCLREKAIRNMSKAAAYNKTNFDKNKAKVTRFKEGELVLLKNEERHQTKLAPKFKGPFRVAEVLDGDRYLLKQLHGNRTCKYAHESLRKLPEGHDLEENELDYSQEASVVKL